jgi:cytochrome c biogenesis protein CcmG/thiol:disulfide interchange protein DsbE
VWLLPAVILAAGFGCGGPSGEGGATGVTAPRFKLTTQTGEVIESGSLKGQFVVLNFWSTTCGPCLRELPHLQELDDSGHAKVIGVAIDQGGWGAVRPLLAKHKVRFAVALGDEELFEKYDGYSIPHTVLIDRSQQVAKVFRGAVTREQLDKEIAAVEQREKSATANR